jgi:hypothetical protein
MLVAELGGPTMFARIGVMRALNRRIERIFKPSRKDHHWERRKLAREQRRSPRAAISSQEVKTIRSRTMARGYEFAVGQSVFRVHSKDFKRQYHRLSGSELPGRMFETTSELESNVISLLQCRQFV